MCASGVGSHFRHENRILGFPLSHIRGFWFLFFFFLFYLFLLCVCFWCAPEKKTDKFETRTARKEKVELRRKLYGENKRDMGFEYAALRKDV